jgi:hypothetical protein
MAVSGHRAVSLSTSARTASKEEIGLEERELEPDIKLQLEREKD